MYSNKLQHFESNFQYPLNQETFKIQHGNNNYDYFSFFEKMGKVNYLVLEIK